MSPTKKPPVGVARSVFRSRRESRSSLLMGYFHEMNHPVRMPTLRIQLALNNHHPPVRSASA